ncbi:MAG: stage V sporulation protein T [Ruminococcus sp.]|nr:stage V sporulation protein T [Ruminococcus sp.]
MILPFIQRRMDSLGSAVITKEIKRTLRIREGDPLHTTLTLFDKFCIAIHSVVSRCEIGGSSPFL